MIQIFSNVTNVGDNYVTSRGKTRIEVCVQIRDFHTIVIV